MRKSDQPLEPSIEEILASIRKIIADDGVQGGVADLEPIAATAAPEVTPFRPPPQSNLVRYQQEHEYEPAEPAEAASEDDIIELTEDIILDERSEQSNPGLTEFAPRGADRFAHLALQAGAEADRESVNAKLENVFSSVAAEVERLSQGQGLKPEGAESSGDADDWDEPAQVRHAVETYTAAAAAVRPHPKFAPESSAERESDPNPQLTLRHAPPDAMPRATVAAQPRTQSRPVWSGRHRDGEGPQSRKTKDEDEAAASQAESAPHAPANVGRDSWAEGIQMPVPDTGPTVPFASAPDEEQLPEPPVAASPPQAEIEKERDYVGGVLTRVFGRSQKKDEEAPAAAAPAAPKSMAEKLAKTTISDFAAQKLRAPAVAEVLQADKPFMEAITESLESALSNVEAGDSAPAAPNKPSKDTPMTEAQPAPYDELPDALLPLDSELALFSPGQVPGFLRASAAARQATADKTVIGKPAYELQAKASEAVADAGEPKSGLFGDEPDAPLAPLRAAPQPSRPAAPLPDTVAAPQFAMPAGIEESIKELIKPLIIQWLNENMPRIVEKAVRDELSEQGGVTGFRREGTVRR